ncbi:hypothetical protein QTO34_006028 [Cnephaeus nilssonii]|uniref:Tumor necrosis factor receptor superfamily member 6 n=1 Tax=Cnephaeus nilssonii TaxID=3371016 RepID=A0AA40LJ88_CNENI|nr:hypothetical protein QTO34_006028 [Eptesicus nilssonii]
MLLHSNTCSIFLSLVLAGERKKDDCKADGDKLVCEPCPEGKEYTDKEHYSPKCRRCGICDGEHGLEVEKNCTKTQNAKCRCKPNYFCNTPPCEHCDPCRTIHISFTLGVAPAPGSDSCTNILAVTVVFPPRLRPESDRNFFHLLVVKRWRQNNNRSYEPTPPDTEIPPVIAPDVDLTDYISTIAELMTISEVRDFVRKNGLKEAKIDEIKNDNLQNTAEQKVQLLRNWYQVHGKKDAFATLITGLRKIQLCTHADKILDIVQKDIASKHENTNFTNKNESQNLV